MAQNAPRLNDLLGTNQRGLGPSEEVAALNRLFSAFNKWSFGPETHPVVRAAFGHLDRNYHEMLSVIHELSVQALKST